MRKKSASKPVQSVHREEISEADKFGLERLVFFSDAVFAIAITLLALEIRLPEIEGPLTDAKLLQALQSIGPQYLAFMLSFLVIGVFWIGHHRRYRFIERYDSVLLFLNLLLLMIVAFIPFPTAIISDYGNLVGTIFYALTMVAAGLVSLAIWGYAASHHRLIDPHMSAHQIRRETILLLTTPIIFSFSMGVAFINTDAAKFTWILVAFTRLLLPRPDDD
ncbi:MAG: DUF1211 domain-containing protein [Anaerolineae bacterium]|nr:DUF1211 domain-containing protein [Anaerolineae bacterium]